MKLRAASMYRQPLLNTSLRDIFVQLLTYGTLNNQPVSSWAPQLMFSGAVQFPKPNRT